MTAFALDPLHSQVEFVARHMVFSKVRGNFGSFQVNLEVDESTHLPTSITAEIDASSIDTRVADRDAHLRSADFLHAEEHSTITFRSARISGTAEKFKVEGDLTIRGVTKPVTLDATYDGGGKDPWGNERVGYSATTSVNRKDFGLTWNQALETGGVLVGENIEIILTIEAVKAQTPAAV
jgi:polyisoprenoid-binding protein YceI